MSKNLFQPPVEEGDLKFSDDDAKVGTLVREMARKQILSIRVLEDRKTFDVNGYTSESLETALEKAKS